MRREIFFIIVSAVLWGTIGIFTKFLIEENIFPLQILFFRLTLSLVFIVPILVIFRKLSKLKIPRTDLKVFLLFGLVIALFQGLTLLSIMFTTVSKAFLLINIHPVFIVILAWLFFKEEIEPLKILSVILGISGVVLIMGLSNIQFLSEAIAGDILAVMTSFFFASYIILAKDLRKKHEWYPTFVYPMMFALIWIIPLFLIVNSLNPQAASFTMDISMNSWLLICGIVLLPTVIAYCLYFEGVKQIPATTVSLLTLLEPISAVLLAFLILKETITYNTIFGGILILLSNYLIIPKRGNRYGRPVRR